MRKIFTHENRLIVFNIRNLLEEQGIACQLRNEFSGGGVGDLAAFETWPELWVEDGDQARAEALLDELDQDVPPAWHCAHCGEDNEGQFKICWQCGRPMNSTATQR